jgi:hypothetical protein
MKTFAQKIKEQLVAGAVMRPKVPLGTTYNVDFVKQVWAAEGIPAPQLEFQFDATRKWRFDFAWPQLAIGNGKLAMEVQGGIWTHGRHTRGAALKKEWEKLNAAAAQGWRILYCEPKDLTSTEMVQAIKAALTTDEHR